MVGKSYRVVLDTNVLFEGLTKKESSCGLLVDVWLAELIQVCVSDALAYEYVDVLSRKFSPAIWLNTQTALKTLLLKANFTSIHYTWRPASPDPGDDLVIDCAMNANALLVTSNKKDFLRAQTELGLVVMAPLEFIAILAE
ncbi:MAG: putative toxin-antitoxin system toxin component, PIN family [Anaerolineaceae bacterium]|nr:putative toxin-antitoxin system toxin component, PIN family [Anaerolineaceae bacterium]